MHYELVSGIKYITLTEQPEMTGTTINFTLVAKTNYQQTTVYAPYTPPAMHNIVLRGVSQKLPRTTNFSCANLLLHLI